MPIEKAHCLSDVSYPPRTTTTTKANDRGRPRDPERRCSRPGRPNSRSPLSLLLLLLFLLSSAPTPLHNHHAHAPREFPPKPSITVDHGSPSPNIASSVRPSGSSEFRITIILSSPPRRGRVNHTPYTRTHPPVWQTPPSRLSSLLHPSPKHSIPFITTSSGHEIVSGSMPLIVRPLLPMWGTL
jgi:hypothetical protein